MEYQKVPLSNELLHKVFMHNLNRIYFTKQHVNAKMPHLIQLASFKKLQQGMEEFWGDVKKQITRMQNIFAIMGETPTDENCNPFKAIVKDEFYLDERNDIPLMKDMDIVHYMQMLEHINITAYRLLKTVAKALKYDEVAQLLMECFDESIDNDQLFVLISLEYIEQ